MYARVHATFIVEVEKAFSICFGCYHYTSTSVTVKLINFLSTKTPLEKPMMSMIWLEHFGKLLIVYRSGLSSGKFNLSHC